MEDTVDVRRLISDDPFMIPDEDVHFGQKAGQRLGTPHNHGLSLGFLIRFRKKARALKVQLYFGTIHAPIGFLFGTAPFHISYRPADDLGF